MRYTLVVMGTLTLLAASTACGQTCPLNGVASNKLVCLIPQVYGPFGFNAGGTIPIDDASLGLKFRAFGRLVVTGNVLIKMNDGGLRSRAVPLVGLSYAF